MRRKWDKRKVKLKQSSLKAWKEDGSEEGQKGDRSKLQSCQHRSPRASDPHREFQLNSPVHASKTSLCDGRAWASWFFPTSHRRASRPSPTVRREGSLSCPPFRSARHIRRHEIWGNRATPVLHLGPIKAEHKRCLKRRRMHACSRPRLCSAKISRQTRQSDGPMLCTCSWRRSKWGGERVRRQRGEKQRGVRKEKILFSASV
jgi:hypothetical protein